MSSLKAENRRVVVVTRDGDSSIARRLECLAGVSVEILPADLLMSGNAVPPAELLVAEHGSDSLSLRSVIEAVEQLGVALPVVAWMNDRDAEAAVEAMRIGACDCLFADDPERMLLVLQSADYRMKKSPRTSEFDSLTFYRAVVDVSPHGIVLSDPDGIITFTNPAHEKLLGYKNDERVGGRVWDLLPSEEEQVAAQAQYERIVTEQPEAPVVVTKLMTKDNRLLEVLVHIGYVRDRRGTLLGVCSLTTDVTDLTEMRIELSETARRYEMLFDGSPAALWELDLSEARDALAALPDDVDDDGRRRAIRSTLEHVVVRAANHSVRRFLDSDDGGESSSSSPAWASWPAHLAAIEDSLLELWTQASDGAEFETGLMLADGANLLYVMGTLSVLPGSAQTWRKMLLSMMDITARHRVEVELTESYDTLLALVESTDDYILVSDASGRPVFFNTRYGAIMSEFLGFPMQPGVKAHEYFDDPEDIAFWEGKHQRVLAGEKFSFEYEYESLGQPIRHLEVSYNPIRREGEVVGFSEVTRNITTRKMAEDALRDSEHRFRLLVESSPLAILVHREGLVVYANQQALELFGMSREEDLTGRCLKDFVMPEDLNGFLQHVTTVQPATAVSGLEIRIRRLDGRQVDLYVRTMPITYSAGDARMVLCRDVTEEKRTRLLLSRRDAILEAVGFAAQRFLRTPKWRDCLAEVVERLGKAAEVDRVVVCVTGETEDDQPPGGEVESWTRLGENGMPVCKTQILDLSGEGLERWREEFSCGEVIAGNVHELPEAKRLLTACGELASVVVVPVFASGRWWGALQCYQCDGLRTWETPEIDALGAAASALGAAIERQRAEEQEEIRRRQLIQADKMASLGVLVSGVAHEINNPNQFILSNAELLRRVIDGIRPVVDDYYAEHGDFLLAGIDYSELRPRLANLCGHLIDGSNRIGVIVKALRDFAQERPAALTDDVDLNEVISSSVVLLGSMVAKAATRLEQDYEPGLPSVRGSFQQLEQVVINLIQNACQALQSHRGRLILMTRWHRAEEEVVVTITDEGSGISGSDLDSITDPFFTTRRDSGGTGLGLSISSGIIREHDGRLQFDSELGKGTTVKIVLPMGQST